MKIQRPFFSIITVSYNADSHIEQTIQSVLSQSCDDFEYIIIDGKSSDNTVKIIEKYRSKIAFFVSEQDKGIYDAMNKGIQRAKGFWLGIINADDWYEKDALEQIKEAVSKNSSCEVCYGKIRIWDADTKQSVVLSPEANKKKMLVGSTIYHPSVFIKKSAYEKFLYDQNYPIVADWLLLNQLLRNGIRFLYIPSVIANFRKGGKSNNKFKNVLEMQRVRRHELGISFTSNIEILILTFWYAILRKTKRGKNDQ